MDFKKSEKFFNPNLENEKNPALVSGSRKKSWLPTDNAKIPTELLYAMASTDDHNVSREFVNNILEQNIDMNDLSAITNSDLLHFGLEDPKQREELISAFACLPKQVPTYENISKLPEAKYYNNEIITKAAEQLKLMTLATQCANDNLRLTLPRDVCVGEKSFASRFIVEALKELEAAADEIDKEIALLLPEKKRKPVKKSWTWVLYGAITAATLASILAFKFLPKP